MSHSYRLAISITLRNLKKRPFMLRYKSFYILDNLEITLTDCEKQSHFIFTANEIIENYYKIYDGRCVILNSNKDMYTIKENHIIRKEESDLNNTFAIENDLLTLTFTGKDEDGTEHIAVIILKKTKPIEYIK